MWVFNTPILFCSLNRSRPCPCNSSSLSLLQEYVQWKAQLQFCYRFSLTPLPAFDRLMLSRVSVAQDRFVPISNVCLLHIHHGFACDVLNSFPVALTKEGLKRIMGTKSRLSTL